jgi:hypothetical protein
MEIAACRTYHAVLSGSTMLSMPDAKSVYKVYYISIIGRDQPELFEWEHCARSKEEFEQAFAAHGFQGIGFAIAFPHITKVFRFAPTMETVLDIGEFETDGIRPKNCDRGDGFHEFACYAEAVIAAEEYHAWACAASVPEYLETRCSSDAFPVASNDKLARYWSV